MTKVILALQGLAIALIVTGLALIYEPLAFLGAGAAVGGLAYLHDPDRTR